MLRKTKRKLKWRHDEENSNKIWGLHHDATCFYPDANAQALGTRSGVPQFYLNKTIGGKDFIVVKEVR